MGSTESASFSIKEEDSWSVFKGAICLLFKPTDFMYAKKLRCLDEKETFGFSKEEPFTLLSNFFRYQESL